MNTVLILAGGSSHRFGRTKQFCKINGIPLFIYILKTLESYSKIITMPEKDINIALELLDKHGIRNTMIIPGGRTRQESVHNGLNTIQRLGCVENVVITDACRPCITKNTVDEMFRLLDTEQAVVAACKSVNTICNSDDEYLTAILDRTTCYDLLMPQAFNFHLLYTAHITTTKTNATDDSQLLTNIPIKIFPISFWEGIKLTYPEDYTVIKMLLEGRI